MTNLGHRLQSCAHAPEACDWCLYLRAVAQRQRDKRAGKPLTELPRFTARPKITIMPTGKRHPDEVTHEDGERYIPRAQW